MVELISTPDQTVLCHDQIKSLRKTPLDLNTTLPFIDIYHTQTEEIEQALLKVHGGYYYLLEGASKQGKSTFGMNLFNHLAKKQDVWPLYIALHADDPKNLYKKLDKCNGNVFEAALDKLQRENPTEQIIIIVDNIQHAFEKEEIAKGLLDAFKNMKTYRLNFLYISSQNSVISKME